MIEAGSWELIKGILNWVVYPVVLLLGYFFKKQAGAVEMLQKDVEHLKITQAVTTSQIKDIREDIKDLTSVVREAEKTITSDIKTLRKDLLDARNKH